MLDRTPSLEETVEVPGNVKVAQFIPFVVLFEYASVLVSNGGFGTVQMALSHGVPMVLAGRAADKADSNARAARMDAAIDLAREEASPEQVGEAVRSVLGDSERKKRCLENKEEYAKYDALHGIIDVVEELSAA